MEKTKKRSSEQKHRWTEHLFVLSLSFYGTPSFAEAPSAHPWLRIAAGIFLEDLQNKNPTSSGGIEDNFDDSAEYIPELTLGAKLNFERLRLQTWASYQHGYLGSELHPYHLPLDSQRDYPETLVRENFNAHIDSEVLLSAPTFYIGLSLDKLWAKLLWQSEVWDPHTRLLITPWLEYRWTEQNQSFLFFPIEQRLHSGEEQSSYKIEPHLFKRPSLKFSHIFAPSEALRATALFGRQELIFEDFWDDQVEQTLSIGSELVVFEQFSLFAILSTLRRDFNHPWKRNGSCSGPLGERGFDFYIRDAANCYRQEKEESMQVGITWELLEEFRISSTFDLLTRHSREEEFDILRRDFLISVSWQTGSSVLSDPLRNFLPWAYSGRTF